VGWTKEHACRERVKCKAEVTTNHSGEWPEATGGNRRPTTAGDTEGRRQATQNEEIQEALPRGAWQPTSRSRRKPQAGGGEGGGRGRKCADTHAAGPHSIEKSEMAGRGLWRR